MQTRRSKSMVLIVVCVALVFGLGSCSDGAGEEKFAAAGASESLPFTSLVDWVSYGSQVAVFEVVSEEEIAGSDEDEPEPSTLRRLSVVVERVLWSSGPQPDRLSLVTFGWRENADGRRPVGPSEGPRLEVGGRYVGSLVDFSGGSGTRWGVQTGSSVLLVEGDTVRASDRASPAAERLDNMSIDELASELSETEPDPLAASLSHLPPAERSLQVQSTPPGG